MPTTVRLREGVNDLLKKRFSCSTDWQVAQRVGINKSQWSRVLRGECLPGAKLQDLLLGIDGLSFNDLFEVVVEEPAGRST
jgi:hypothetical protein